MGKYIDDGIADTQDVVSGCSHIFPVVSPGRAGRLKMAQRWRCKEPMAICRHAFTPKGRLILPWHPAMPALNSRPDGEIDETDR